nr:hypothetical protein [Stenoxybacter acetivorans]
MYWQKRTSGVKDPYVGVGYALAEMAQAARFAKQWSAAYYC